ncbi:MAG: hypothetical protein R3E82_15560 [Pseudomonadales bacterium]|nr:hypothetical protein [Pseudomonadales bacterium]
MAGISAGYPPSAGYYPALLTGGMKSLAGYSSAACGEEVARRVIGEMQVAPAQMMETRNQG